MADLVVMERLVKRLQPASSDEGFERQIQFLRLDADYVLDDLVHQVKSDEAADINNGGFERQIQFLLDAGMTEAEIAEAIDEELKQ